MIADWHRTHVPHQGRSSAYVINQATLDESIAKAYGDLCRSKWSEKFEGAKPQPSNVDSKAEAFLTADRDVYLAEPKRGGIAPASLHVCTNSPIAERTEADLHDIQLAKGGPLDPRKRSDAKLTLQGANVG